MYTNSSNDLKVMLADLAYGVIGDAMVPRQNLEPAQIEARSAGSRHSRATGTDATSMRDLLAAELIRTGGFAERTDGQNNGVTAKIAIFGSKVGRFVPSVLHALRRSLPWLLAALDREGTMPSSSSAWRSRPWEYVNAGNPRAAPAGEARLRAAPCHECRILPGWMRRPSPRHCVKPWFTVDR